MKTAKYINGVRYIIYEPDEEEALLASYEDEYEELSLNGEEKTYLTGYEKGK